MKKNNFWKSKFFIVVVIGLIFFLIAYKNPSNIFAPFQALGQIVISPVQHIGSTFGYSFRSFTGVFGKVTNLKKENNELQKKNLELIAQKASLEQLAAENEELRRNLELLPKGERQFFAASVIAKDPSGLQNTVTIDKGTDDGVRSGMAVVVETGVLVGTVSQAFKNTASITLVTDQASIVNVETSKTAIRGVARGEHGINITLDMVEQGQELKAGDAIVTSGLGGEYPRGLLVGTLTDVRFSEDKLFQQANISSPIRINAIRFVFLIR